MKRIIIPIVMFYSLAHPAHADSLKNLAALNPIPITAGPTTSFLGNQPEKAGFLESAYGAYWGSVGPQFVMGAMNELVGSLTAEPGYNPWPEMDGYEDFADKLLWAKSPAHMLALKSQIDENTKMSQLAAEGGIVARVVGAIMDPISLILIPLVFLVCRKMRRMNMWGSSSRRQSGSTQ